MAPAAEVSFQIELPGGGGQLAGAVLLAGFLLSFAFIRMSTRLMRSPKVSWWPGSIQTEGGIHVHHLVFGIVLLMLAGFCEFAFQPESPWLEILAAAFGVGMGLTLDEFALWLNLQDVYWSEKGRQSIDAVVVTTALLVIAVLGLEFWVAVWDAVLVLAGMNDGHAWVAVPVQLLGIALAVLCFRRGRKLTGIVGLFIPLVALLGAVIPSRQPASSTA